MLISLLDYSLKVGRDVSRIRRKCIRGDFKTAQKIGRNWVIDSEEKYEDKRKKEFKMKKISLDNGRTYLTAKEAMIVINERNLWDVVVNMMDDDMREKVHSEFVPCTEEEFLNAYLSISNHDLIIG